MKGDVRAAANPCRRFFQLEVETRIIAAALKILGLNSLDPKEKPTKNVFPNQEDASTKQEKKHYLRKIATLVVDEFVIDQERNRKIMQSVQLLEREQQVKEQEIEAEGRYPCRSPGCTKTFAHDGKLRRDHEARHNPPVVIHGPSSNFLTIDSETSEDKRDDMFAYQKALLDYGMLILNFKKLGPSASQKSLDRICNSLDVTAAMMKLFDSNLSVFRRSGKHIQRSTKNDTEKLVNELLTNKSFTYTPGRKYTSYAKMKPSILCGFNLQKMFTWINEHKKHMILYRRAR